MEFAELTEVLRAAQPSSVFWLVFWAVFMPTLVLVGAALLPPKEDK